MEKNISGFKFLSKGVSKKRKETREQWWGVGPRSVHVMESNFSEKKII